VSFRQLLNKRVLGYLSWLKSRRRHYRRDILDRVVQDVRQHQIEHILVSGDLTHLGLPQECRQAREWLQSLGTPEKVSLVPGNHERYVQADWEATLGQWADYFTPEVQTEKEAGFPTLQKVQSIAVIGVNSAVPTPPFFASGCVGKAQRERLSEILRRCRNEGLFRLIMIHHSPLKHGHSWRKRLQDAEEMTELLIVEGAELVVHGHGHIEGIHSIAGGAGEIPVLAAPSASRFGEGRAGWNHLSISECRATDQDKAAWRVELACRRFFPEESKLPEAAEAAEKVLSQPLNPPIAAGVPGEMRTTHEQVFRVYQN